MIDMGEIMLIDQRIRSMKEVRQILEEIRKRREGNWDRYGKDGSIELWRKVYVYRGVKYEIACMKYFSFNREDPLEAKILDMDRYLILKCTEDEEPIAELIEGLNLHQEWLYADTLHTQYIGMSLEEQEKALHQIAKQDIDWLLDQSVAILRQQLQKLEEMIKKLGEGK